MGSFERKDHFWRKAKEEGYRSRAAYKLIQLQHQYRIFRKGDKVVDLGCAPGGWLQVIAEIVGPDGVVVGLDQRTVESLPYPNVHCVVGGIHDEHTRKQIITLLSGAANVVTSDMAPDLSGIRFRDHHCACELVAAGLEFCKESLRKGGTYLAKTFEGEELKDLDAQFRRLFSSVRRIVPDASRKGSSEIYFLASGFTFSKATTYTF